MQVVARTNAARQDIKAAIRRDNGWGQRKEGSLACRRGRVAGGVG